MDKALNYMSKLVLYDYNLITKYFLCEIAVAILFLAFDIFRNYPFDFQIFVRNYFRKNKYWDFAN